MNKTILIVALLLCQALTYKTQDIRGEFPSSHHHKHHRETKAEAEAEAVTSSEKEGTDLCLSDITDMGLDNDGNSQCMICRECCTHQLNCNDELHKDCQSKWCGICKYSEPETKAVAVSTNKGAVAAASAGTRIQRARRNIVRDMAELQRLKRLDMLRRERLMARRERQIIRPRRYPVFLRGVPRFGPRFPVGIPRIPFRRPNIIRPGYIRGFP